MTFDATKHEKFFWLLVDTHYRQVKYQAKGIAFLFFFGT